VDIVGRVGRIGCCSWCAVSARRKQRRRRCARRLNRCRGGICVVAGIRECLERREIKKRGRCRRKISAASMIKANRGAVIVIEAEEAIAIPSASSKHDRSTSLPLLYIVGLIQSRSTS